MFKSILKNSVAVFSFQVVSRVISFFSFVLIARILGVETIGNYAYIISICALLGLFIEFGTNQFLVKKVASVASSSMDVDIANIIALKIIQFITGILILCILEYKVLIKNFHVLNLTLCYVIFEGLAQIGISILNGRKEFIKANTFIFFYETGRSLALLVLLFFYKNIKYIPFIYILFSITYAVILLNHVLQKPISIRHVKNFLSNLSRRTIVSYYKGTYLFFISAIAYQLYFRVDMILLKRLSSSYELGIYSTAYKFFEVFLFVPAILSGIVYPNVVSLYNNLEVSLLKSYTKDIQFKAAGLISIIILLLIVSSNLIIDSFFGKSYIESAQIMQLLFLTSFLYCFNFIYPVLLNATGNEKCTIYVCLSGFIINFSLNYLLLPQYGAKAAAIITFLSELTVTILYYVFLKKKSLEVLHPKALMLILCFITLGCLCIISTGLIGNMQLYLLILSTILIIILVFYRKEISPYLLLNVKQ